MWGISFRFTCLQIQQLLQLLHEGAAELKVAIIPTSASRKLPAPPEVIKAQVSATSLLGQRFCRQ